MNFEELQLHPQLLHAVQKMGFTEPTLIQQKCIPEILNGRDVVGQSTTGSGKTLAFGLPLLQKIHAHKGPQALILTPTRELCVQVADVIQDVAKAMNMRVAQVYGGVGMEPQVRALQHSEIIVGTPGRIMDHIERRNFNPSTITYLVLDEADKMFEMGFQEIVEQIISYTPEHRQTVLFSATMPSSIDNLIRKHLREPLMLAAELRIDRSLLHQFYYEVPQRDKFSLLVHLLKNKHKGLAIIFCATRQEVNIVSSNLYKNGIEAQPIHGGLTQNRRLNALNALKKQDIDVLVATDVAARGLDIKNVTYVYNYDVPKTSEDYIHRVGRTARAGSSGEAITLLTDRDHDSFRRVLSDRTLKLEPLGLPAFERVIFKRREFSERPVSRQSFGRDSFLIRHPSEHSSGSYGGRSEEHGSSGGYHRGSSGGYHGHSGSREGGSFGSREGGSSGGYHRGSSSGYHRTSGGSRGSSSFHSREGSSPRRGPMHRSREMTRRR
ncbi:DEAD/DEAH box helicase [Candidatus Woesearchaeota archaeon]|nr:DEAD/DEAH box helicase [Candidatus Woesearchaeota archaeon]